MRTLASILALWLSIYSSACAQENSSNDALTPWLQKFEQIKRDTQSVPFGEHFTTCMTLNRLRMYSDYFKCVALLEDRKQDLSIELDLSCRICSKKIFYKVNIAGMSYLHYRQGDNVIRAG